MTVRELIDALSVYRQDLPVFLDGVLVEMDTFGIAPCESIIADWLVQDKTGEWVRGTGPSQIRALVLS